MMPGRTLFCPSSWPVFSNFMSPPADKRGLGAQPGRSALKLVSMIDAPAAFRLMAARLRGITWAYPRH